MADFDRPYQSEFRSYADYDRGHRTEFRAVTEYYGPGHGSEFRAVTDYNNPGHGSEFRAVTDRSKRGHGSEFRGGDDYDQGYRNQFRGYGGGGGGGEGGERKLEIVKGSVFSASQVYAAPRGLGRARSPEPPRRGSRAVAPSSSGGGGPWCFSDPEMKRRRRVASYKAYSVEGKVKASLRKGFRWIKGKCSEIIHGW